MKATVRFLGSSRNRTVACSAWRASTPFWRFHLARESHHPILQIPELQGRALLPLDDKHYNELRRVQLKVSWSSNRAVPFGSAISRFSYQHWPQKFSILINNGLLSVKFSEIPMSTPGTIRSRKQWRLKLLAVSRKYLNIYAKPLLVIFSEEYACGIKAVSYVFFRILLSKSMIISRICYKQPCFVCNSNLALIYHWDNFESNNILETTDIPSITVTTIHAIISEKNI